MLLPLESQAVRCAVLHADVDIWGGTFKVVVEITVRGLTGSDPGGHVFDAAVDCRLEIGVADRLIGIFSDGDCHGVAAFTGIVRALGD